ncbi:hypothetical protein D8832_06285 [Streptococcus intermedius]|nr:hypothetical protein D8832_06285 [Streptococcus intermedius]
MVLIMNLEEWDRTKCSKNLVQSSTPFSFKYVLLKLKMYFYAKIELIR